VRAPVAPPRPSAEPHRVEEVARPSQPQPAKIGRTPRQAREDLLAELFEAVSRLAGQKDRKAGLAFLLDLAMEKLGCEAGSVFLAGLGDETLHFEVVRGPRAAELSTAKLTVPVGVGIVGYCAQENVCVAVSDAVKDERFHRAISEAIGYETRSLLCAPIARQGLVVGAIEVLNRRSGAPFDPGDVAVLAYLATQAAEFLHRLDR
jgi:sigma-B regulation protein RsbU (phosphoserine phosphatase)